MTMATSTAAGFPQLPPDLRVLQKNWRANRLTAETRAIRDAVEKSNFVHGFYIVVENGPDLWWFVGFKRDGYMLVPGFEPYPRNAICFARKSDAKAIAAAFDPPLPIRFRVVNFAREDVRRRLVNAL
jgi:hypothetical protein